MTNYVASYKFSDPELETDFATRLKKQFPKLEEEKVGPITFLAFEARQEPAVEDNIRHSINSSKVANDDLVALYFSAKNNPHEIKRVLILGSDEVAEAKLQHITKEPQNNMLVDFLEKTVE